MHPYMAAPSARADMSDDPETATSLPPRHRRLMFRAWHRGTKEADLMIGGFVQRHIAAFTDSELDELEAVLELPDVDLADWLSGRRPIPREVATPMLARMAEECAGLGAGVPPELRPATPNRSRS
jgi:antitoxin CptB